MNSCFSLSLFFFFGRAGARRVETQIYYFCVVGTEKHTQACGLSACRSCTRAGTSSLASSSTTATRPATTPAGRCPPTLTLLVNDTSVSISSSAWMTIFLDNFLGLLMDSDEWMSQATAIGANNSTATSILKSVCQWLFFSIFPLIFAVFIFLSSIRYRTIRTTARWKTRSCWPSRSSARQWTPPPSLPISVRTAASFVIRVSMCLCCYLHWMTLHSRVRHSGPEGRHGFLANSFWKSTPSSWNSSWKFRFWTLIRRLINSSRTQTSRPLVRKTNKIRINLWLQSHIWFRCLQKKKNRFPLPCW